MIAERTLYHVTKRENYESIMKHGLIAQAGERSKQLGEQEGVFLFPSIEDMETALGQWLGWEFEDEDELYALEVTLPNNWPLEKTCEFERVSRLTIDPKHIRFHSEQ